LSLLSPSLRAVAIKLARAAGATAMGITAGFLGSSVPVARPSTNLAAAESVASRFVTGFEEFSYRDPDARTAVADLATPGLAAVLTSPSQAATGPALAAEKFTATADVVGFEVEGDSPTSVDLLARTDVHVSTKSGSSSSIRLVPVSLVLTATVWKVSGVAGLTAPTAVPVPSGSPDAPTTVPAGTATTSPPPEPSVVPGASSNTTPAAAPAPAVGDVPAQYASWMKAAVAAQCPGLPWTVLAGIGKVESDFGRSTLPGVRSGSNPEGAEGPMQFEPATFAAYGIVAPGGADPPSPYDPADAIYSAATLLCADGGGNPARLYDAIFDYNHSDAYVSLVIAYADEYAQMASGGDASGTGLGSVIVADAEAYLGTPYVWGGENPRTGFDCSGLVQWVYAEADISLPRVAQDQYDAGPHLAAGATLYPGDLVFFGSGPSDVEHVGIYVGNGEMIDAPYTGAVVRFDRVATVPLGYVGATRPEIPDMTTVAGIPVFSPVSVDPSDGASLSDVSWHQTGTSGSSAPSHGHHLGHGHQLGNGLSTGDTHTGHHHSTPTTTTVPDPTRSPGPGRHHHSGTTTTTSSTSTSTTTSTTSTSTTTSVPTATTTTTTTPPDPTTMSTTAASSDSTPGTGRAGRHHQKGG
jgi:cell wall-associated NlpC family hydrolase